MANKTSVVKFAVSRDNNPMAYVEGKISFPDRQGQQPEIGEIWEVEVSGQNPKGTVNFLRMVRKVEMVEWSWDNQIGSRGRRPACLVITKDGNIHRFTGSDIDGVVKVVNSNYTKQGKWSHTTFSCISPEGTKVYSWSQSWGEGLYWPQASWEEAIATIQSIAPQVKPEAVEAIIREDWGKAAEKFDENRAAMQAFAGVDGPMEWTWNDGLASRSRRPSCLVITSEGEVYRFEGRDIEGVVKVTKEDYEQNGKWSNSTYHCVSPSGTSIYSWRQSWEEGLFWPQTSWEEVIAEVQGEAPQAKPESIEAVVREYWGKSAQKFDSYRVVVLEDFSDKEVDWL